MIGRKGRETDARPICSARRAQLYKESGKEPFPVLRLSLCAA